MSVQFVIGRAGSGKTHLLREYLVAHVMPDPLTQNVTYLVPKQATFTTQRAIAADPRLNGFCGVRVIAPEDLAEIAMIETGHPAGARLDAIGRSLILGHLLKSNVDALQHFNRSAARPGLAREVDGAFREFERAGRDITEIDAVIDKNLTGEASQQTLARKLTDLKLIYFKYQEFLREHGFNPFQRQQEAPAAISEWAEARNALLLVDDFYDFTAYERQLIAALAKVVPRAYVAVLMDPASRLLSNPDLLPDDLGLFYRTEWAYRNLYFALKKEQIAIDAPHLLHTMTRFADAGLRAVEQSLGVRKTTPAKHMPAIRLMLAADVRGELQTAAREIKRLLRDGYRLRDVCVLARSVDHYADSIDAVFKEYDIPFFLDRRRPAQHHPLIKTLQAMLQIVQTRWSHDSVFDLLKAGLTKLNHDAVDLLQTYTNEHRLMPSCWTDSRAWAFARREFDDVEHHTLFTPREIADANAARSMLVAAMGVIGDRTWADESHTLRKRMRDLFAVLDRFGVRDALLKRIKDAEEVENTEAREEEEQIWAAWAELADRLTELLGDVVITGQAFAELLQTALGELELAIIPPTIDQVLVGAIDRTRTGPVRAAIVLGMNACEFPRCERERAVLNDADRHHLLRRGIEVDRPSRDALMTENFLGYLALSRASERLTLIRVARDRDGNEQQASPFWDAVCATTEDAFVERPADAIERISTAEQAVSHLLTWARHTPAIVADESAALYQWLAIDAGDGSQRVRDRAWPALRYRNRATLSPGMAAQLFASPLEASVSRFESFAACPFQHFARYGLRLQRPCEQEFSALDLGNLYHAVLENVVADALRQKIDFATGQTVSQQQIRQIAQDVGQTLSNQIFLSSARNRFTLDQIETTALRLVQAQQFQLGGGSFRPAFTELTFGDRKQLPPVQLDTPNGHVVKLRGKIDRVDIDPAADVFSVIDYKLGGKTLDYSHIAHGLMLQLLTYLLVLKQHGEMLTQRPLTAAAAMYVKVLRSITHADHPLNAPEPETDAFHTKEKPRGVINQSHMTRFDPSLAGGGQSKLVSVKIKKDGTFWESGNDAVDSADFEALIRFVERQIALTADSIIGGDIGIDPFMIAKETACQRCDLRRVCRFDRAINGYRQLDPLSRTEALVMIRTHGGAADAR